MKDTCRLLPLLLGAVLTLVGGCSKKLETENEALRLENKTLNEERAELRTKLAVSESKLIAADDASNRMVQQYNERIEELRKAEATKSDDLRKLFESKASDLVRLHEQQISDLRKNYEGQIAEYKAKQDQIEQTKREVAGSQEKTAIIAQRNSFQSALQLLRVVSEHEITRSALSAAHIMAITGANYRASAQYKGLVRHIAESKTRFWELTSPNLDREDVRKISAAMREYYDQIPESVLKHSQAMSVAYLQGKIMNNTSSASQEAADLTVNEMNHRSAKLKTFDEEINRLK